MMINCRDRVLETGHRTLVMGILNVTPDSFSDGGKNYLVSDALKTCERMIEEGADIIDVGGESTRPGYREISVDEELSRIVPVIEGIVSNLDIAVSVDTYKSRVAKGALSAGAHIINDIYGFHYDPDMAKTVAAYDAAAVLMFNCRRNGECSNEDITSRAIRELMGSIDLAHNEGISDDRIITDPGIGFGTAREQDRELIANVSRLSLGGRYPVLLATSRKRLAAELLGRETAPDQRDPVSIGMELAGIVKGADLVRVHNVKDTVDAIRGFEAIMR